MYSIYCSPTAAAPLINSTQCAHTLLNKHAQDSYFQPICSRDRELSAIPSKAHTVEAKLMHIYHFFNLHWEQGVWEGNVDLHPPLPPLHWSSLGFLCIPSPNQQTGCLSFASVPWAKVTFSLLCDIRFWGRGLLSQREVAFFSVPPLALITSCCLAHSPLKKKEEAWSV